MEAKQKETTFFITLAYLKGIPALKQRRNYKHTKITLPTEEQYFKQLTQFPLGTALVKILKSFGCWIVDSRMNTVFLADRAIGPLLAFSGFVVVLYDYYPQLFIPTESRKHPTKAWRAPIVKCMPEFFGNLLRWTTRRCLSDMTFTKRFKTWIANFQYEFLKRKRGPGEIIMTPAEHESWPLELQKETLYPYPRHLRKFMKLRTLKDAGDKAFRFFSSLFSLRKCTVSAPKVEAYKAVEGFRNLVSTDGEPIRPSNRFTLDDFSQKSIMLWDSLLEEFQGPLPRDFKRSVPTPSSNTKESVAQGGNRTTLNRVHHHWQRQGPVVSLSNVGGVPLSYLKDRRDEVIMTTSYDPLESDLKKEVEDRERSKRTVTFVSSSGGPPVTVDIRGFKSPDFRDPSFPDPDRSPDEQFGGVDFGRVPQAGHKNRFIPGVRNPNQTPGLPHWSGPQYGYDPFSGYSQSEKGLEFRRKFLRVVDREQDSKEGFSFEKPDRDFSFIYRSRVDPEDLEGKKCSERYLANPLSVRDSVLKELQANSHRTTLRESHAKWWAQQEDNSKDHLGEQGEVLKKGIPLTFVEQYRLPESLVPTGVPLTVLDELVTKMTVLNLDEGTKFRQVTQCEPLRNHLCTAMQKQMHSIIRKHKVFSLVGEAYGTADLNHSAGIDHDTVLPELRTEILREHISGDYDGATNRIRMEATRALFEPYLDRCQFSEFEKEKARESLYSGLFEFSDMKDDEGKPLPSLPPCFQRRGQMMGNVLSFPLLCIANLITYWMAYEESQGVKIRWQDLPVRLNGDDLLGAANAKLYESWLDSIDVVGFKPSAGKNLVSPTYGTINSQPLKFVGGKTIVMKFTRPHLFINASAKASDSSDPIAVHNLLLDTLYNPATIKGFYDFHHDSIAKRTRWGEADAFANPLFGGCGFQRTPFFPSELTAKRSDPKTQKLIRSHYFLAMKGQPTVFSQLKTTKLNPVASTCLKMLGVPFLEPDAQDTRPRLLVCGDRSIGCEREGNLSDRQFLGPPDWRPFCSKTNLVYGDAVKKAQRLLRPFRSNTFLDYSSKEVFIGCREEPRENLRGPYHACIDGVCCDCRLCERHTRRLARLSRLQEEDYVPTEPEYKRGLTLFQKYEDLPELPPWLDVEAKWQQRFYEGERCLETEERLTRERLERQKRKEAKEEKKRLMREAREDPWKMDHVQDGRLSGPRASARKDRPLEVKIAVPSMEGRSWDDLTATEQNYFNNYSVRDLDDDEAIYQASTRRGL